VRISRELIASLITSDDSYIVTIIGIELNRLAIVVRTRSRASHAFHRIELAMNIAPLVPYLVLGLLFGLSLLELRLAG
jgi:hypothetical protein